MTGLSALRVENNMETEERRACKRLLYDKIINKEEDMEPVYSSFNFQPYRQQVTLNEISLNNDRDFVSNPIYNAILRNLKIVSKQFELGPHRGGI